MIEEGRILVLDELLEVTDFFLLRNSDREHLMRLITEHPAVEDVFDVRAWWMNP